MSRSLDGLERALQYSFNEPDLLETALTHRSAGSRNNERLEFLGDAVLGYLIAAWLFERFPDAAEGQLSRLRASLVKGDTLARIARALKLGDYLRLGSGDYEHRARSSDRGEHSRMAGGSSAGAATNRRRNR